MTEVSEGAEGAGERSRRESSLMKADWSLSFDIWSRSWREEAKFEYSAGRDRIMVMQTSSSSKSFNSNLAGRRFFTLTMPASILVIRDERVFSSLQSLKARARGSRGVHGRCRRGRGEQGRPKKRRGRLKKQSRGPKSRVGAKIGRSLSRMMSDLRMEGTNRKVRSRGF